MGKFKEIVNFEVCMGEKTGMVDNSLTRSLILDFGLQKAQAKQAEKPDVAKLGGTLLERAESIYEQTKWARTLAVNAYNNPSRLGCSTVTLTVGLTNMYSGNLISGGLTV